MNKEIYITKWKDGVGNPEGIVKKGRSICRHIILSSLSLLDQKTEDSFLRCLFCHNVFDDNRYNFECAIRELTNIGEFIDTDTCVDILTGKKKIDKKYYHLSFDDGFRNNFTNALPILKKYKVPAIFFVPSSLIGADWADTEKYCLETTEYKSAIEMLKWEDLREIIAQGYEVGSHTRTHARLSAISHDKSLMEEEIFGAKKELESKLDYECKYIAWPYGLLSDSDTVAFEMIKNAGYIACFGGYRGTVSPGHTNVFSIPRHGFEPNWPISHIKYFARGNME